jgi:hypothetical protein
LDPEKDTYRKINRFGQKAPNKPGAPSHPWEEEGQRQGSHKRSFLEESQQSPKKFARNRATGGMARFSQSSRNGNKFVKEEPQGRNDGNIPGGLGFRTAGEQLVSLAVTFNLSFFYLLCSLSLNLVFNSLVVQIKHFIFLFTCLIASEIVTVKLLYVKILIQETRASEKIWKLEQLISVWRDDQEKPGWETQGLE